MSAPLVSILVRSVDRPTLSRPLASIAAQDYPDIEVVVAAIAAHRALPDRCGASPLRLVRAAHPLARADAANAALDAARGDWLDLLDDDGELMSPLVASLLRDEPRSVDGRILQILQLIARGDVEHAKSLLDAIASATPHVEALARKLDEARSRIATPR
jgi:glycosyltransferase involved in cell wall biosynthesis